MRAVWKEKDFEQCECSHCGFTVKRVSALTPEGTDCLYTHCPHCGSEMQAEAQVFDTGSYVSGEEENSSGILTGRIAFGWVWTVTDDVVMIIDADHPADHISLRRSTVRKLPLKPMPDSVIAAASNIPLGTVQSITPVSDVAIDKCLGKYDGYVVKTDLHSFSILIYNGQCCCEDWGYLSTNDNVDDFVGKELRQVYLTDVALNRWKIDDVRPYGFDWGGIQFINFEFTDGATMQLAAYNAHNGYYGHSVYVLFDKEIKFDSCL